MAKANTKPGGALLFEQGLWNRTWFMLLLCLAIWELDWELVPVAFFPFVFIFPVMLVAWNRGLKLSLVCSLAFALSRLAREYALDQHRITLEDKGTALVCFFVLALLAALTHLLSVQSRQLRQRVQQLEGILPICAGCKSIRDEQGHWIQLEGYLTTRTPAQFSHSFCPECYKAFYGDIPSPVANKNSTL